MLRRTRTRPPPVRTTGALSLLDYVHRRLLGKNVLEISIVTKQVKVRVFQKVAFKDDSSVKFKVVAESFIWDVSMFTCALFNLLKSK